MCIFNSSLISLSFSYQSGGYYHAAGERYTIFLSESDLRTKCQLSANQLHVYHLAPMTLLSSWQNSTGEERVVPHRTLPRRLEGNRPSL